MGFRDFFSVFLIFTVFSIYGYAQKGPHFNIESGYIVVVKEKKWYKEQMTYSIDYIFFDSLPDLTKEKNPKTVLDKGGILIDMNYLINQNFEDILMNGFEVFNSSWLFQYQTEKFDLEIYRVKMAAYREMDTLEGFVSRGSSTSHTYSYFINTNDDKMKDEVSVIFPGLIRVW